MGRGKINTIQWKIWGLLENSTELQRFLNFLFPTYPPTPIFFFSLILTPKYARDVIVSRHEPVFDQKLIHKVCTKIIILIVSTHFGRNSSRNCTYVTLLIQNLMQMLFLCSLRPTGQVSVTNRPGFSYNFLINIARTRSNHIGALQAETLHQ